MTDAFEGLRDETTKIQQAYFDELDQFYISYLPEACRLATLNVTDTRLKQVETDLKVISEQMNSSPSFGMFILDLAISFLPVIGGHLLELGLKQAYRDLVMAQRYFDLFKAEELLKVTEGELKSLRMKASNFLKSSDTLYKKYKLEYNRLFSWTKQSRASLIQSKEEFAEVLRSSMTGGVSDPLFEFSTPAINDWFQAAGSQLLGLTENPQLSIFANPPKSQTFEEYNKFALSRFADSPNALVSHIVSDICRRQLQANKRSRSMCIFCTSVMNVEGYFIDQKECYTQLLARLPTGNDLSNFILVMSELLEAAIWLMYLGDPKEWFATKSPSGTYYGVERSGDVYGIEYVPAYFRMKRTLPKEIENHLLDTFHPDLTSPEKKSFRDFYEEAKKKALKTQEGAGIDVPQGYKWGTPNQPDLPPEDVASRSYTAEETALANLQIYFSKMYASMQNSQYYFSNIIANHTVM